MKKSLVIITSVISLLGFTTQSLACLGSSYSREYAPRYDIPSTYDLTISKLPIHSQSYYQWIIQNSMVKTANNQMTLNDYDDLAVAYNKIGEKEKAIELLIPLVRDNPNRFSSVSNLGSIYLNIGDYDNGLRYLRLANTLVPVDSYDREYAQEKVYSYLKSLNKSLPYSFPIQDIKSGKNFADFALKDIPEEKQNDEIIRLIFGIENMVRFGNHDSPVSMEVLGDLYLKFKTINHLNGYREYQLNDNIVDFYTSSLVKSSVKNTDSLKELIEKEDFNYSQNKVENFEQKFKEVKEEREKLEIKEKDIINNNTNIEKSLNELLLSKGSDNIKISIMNEKERLYKILKTKDNEIKATQYLNYVSIADAIAWILLTISGLGAYILILIRNNKLTKHLDLQEDKFNNLNNFTKYMNRALFSVIGISLVVFLIEILRTTGSDLFTITLVIAGLVLLFSAFILFLSNIYLIAFGKYKSKNNYHLDSKNKMKKLIYIGTVSLTLFITSGLAKEIIYDKYEYINSSDSFFGYGTSLRTVN